MENELSNKVIGAAMEVHRVLGPGLLESAYAAALAIELQHLGYRFKRECSVAATYKGKDLGLALRADFVVEDLLILELKAVERLTDQHAAQLLSYLRLSKLKLGLLINFNHTTLKQGLRRIVNDL